MFTCRCGSELFKIPVMRLRYGERYVDIVCAACGARVFTEAIVDKDDPYAFEDDTDAIDQEETFERIRDGGG
jgi:hypothetical protein